MINWIDFIIGFVFGMVAVVIYKLVASIIEGKRIKREIAASEESRQRANIWDMGKKITQIEIRQKQIIETQDTVTENLVHINRILAKAAKK